jgi:hypothetical protein
MNKTAKFLIQFRAIPDDVIKTIEKNFPPKTILNKPYPIFVKPSDRFPYMILDEDNEVNKSCFDREGLIDPENAIDDKQPQTGYHDYTQYFKIVEGVDALPYILNYTTIQMKTMILNNKMYDDILDDQLSILHYFQYR